MSDRLALLRGILANPDDDLRRLVYADWLDDHGTTDADKARAEFIRLACNMKAKTMISRAETKWLDQHWTRVVPQIVNLHAYARRVYMFREGRRLRLDIDFRVGNKPPQSGTLYVDFMRGFISQVRFGGRFTYERAWKAAATDGPLAELTPDESPRLYGDNSSVSTKAWGEEVYDRVVGYDREANGRKYFDRKEGRLVDGIHFPDSPVSRCRVAIALAMTAIAREYTGLTPAPEA